MDNLVKERGSLRTAVTNASKDYEAAINAQEPDSVKIRTTFRKLTDKCERLYQMDEKISIARSKETGKATTPAADYEKEREKIEHYHDILCNCSITFEDFMQQFQGNNYDNGDNQDERMSIRSEAGSQDNSKSTTKLPKHALPKFNGDIRNWLTFWSQFKSKVHENQKLTDDDKMYYLTDCMEKNSEAEEIVQTFPGSGDYYTEAINSLQENYGIPSLLIEIHYRDLIKLLIEKVLAKKDGTEIPLRSLVLKIETQIRALSTLGMTKGNNAAGLYPLIEATLPDKILEKWGSSPDNPGNFEFFEKGGGAKAKEVKAGNDKNNETKDDKCKACGCDCKENKDYQNLELLMRFLKIQVRGEARVKHTHQFTDFSELITERDGRLDTATGGSGPRATAAALVATGSSLTPNRNNPLPCVFCSKESHCSHECIKGAKMSYDDKVKLIKADGRCFKCLKGRHKTPKCHTPVCCPICHGQHYAILCKQLPTTSKPVSTPPDSPQPPKPPNEKKEQFHKPKIKKTSSGYAGSSSNNQEPMILMQTILITAANKGKAIAVRVLCDSGSQRSYIRKDIAQRLELEGKNTETLRHELFGGRLVDIKHNVYKVRLQSLFESYSGDFTLLEQQKICGEVDRLPYSDFTEALQQMGIKLVDYGNADPQEIGILLGADALAKLYTGRIQQLDESLLAIHTKLGWTVMGECQASSLNNACPTGVCISSLSDLWELERLGIRDPFEVESEAQRQAKILESFEKTIERKEDRHYQIHLPWKELRPILDDNLQIVLQRLITTTKKLIRENRYEEYDKILKEWEATGIIEEIDPSEENPDLTHYLPHRGVVRENSESTKLRPVFDASCKDRNKNSLNSILEKGPNLIHLIPSVLTRFRRGPIAAIADIKKAFLQIGIAESDRDMLRFLWWENYEKRIHKVYRHCRVVFGATCSSFLLAATLQYHFSHYGKFDETIDRLTNALYVDDVADSFRNQKEFQKFKSESETILQDGGFELTKWKSNAYHLDPGTDPITSVLGLKWDMENDTLFCATDSIQEPTVITKRTLLSVAHSVFDPLGFTCPATLLPRLLLQETWKIEADWDTPLPPAISNQFKKWLSKIKFLNKCRIPRFLGAYFTADNASLHVFCDASKDAYAAAVFIRIEAQDRVIVQLLQAKNRVSPIKQEKDKEKPGEIIWKKPTIPRLELLAASMSVRLLQTVKEALQTPLNVTYWSDSKTVLCWIKNNDQWSVFVRNRLAEIKKFSSPDQWRFVPGHLNPADLPSRGCNAKQLTKNQWWEGPDWLKKAPQFWPPIDNNFRSHSKEICSELIKTTLSNVNTGAQILVNEPILASLDKQISRYSRIIRARAWINRLLFNRSHPKSKIFGDLRIDEIKISEIIILKIIQSELLKEEDLKRFETFKDENGLIRIKSRVLTESVEEYQHPILIPPCRIVEKLIREQHLLYKHAGVSTLLVALRENYWVLRARKTIKKIVNGCLACKRFNARAAHAPEAPLPSKRTELGPAFKTTGVDLAGPLYLKNNSKVWVVIFTCAVYRAVHLELVTSLTTDCFIMALRRFISRRGKLSNAISDNGTNFVGTANLLKAIPVAEINEPRIKWIFNPPTAAWWGGFWERLVRSLKDLLKRNLGKQAVTYEELITLLCECENILNMRPLTYVSEDDELTPLTPATFIRDITNGEAADLDLIDEKRIRTRANYLNNLRNNLRQRFRKEYLSLLVHHGKAIPATQFREGDIVLIESQEKRLKWQLGKILKIFPGKDGHTRAAEVRTSTGVLKRPIQRLYPLEIHTANLNEASIVKETPQPKQTKVRSVSPNSNDSRSIASDADRDLTTSVSNDEDEIENPSPPVPIVTRRGRVVRPPVRLDLLINSKFVQANDFFVI